MNSLIEISGLKDYIGYVGEIAASEESHLYRGQADEEWRVTSSALRRLETKYADFPDLLPEMCLHYLLQIVDEIKFNYPTTYRNLYPLECLAHLQHNGVATALLDFTFNPLVALWFSCAVGKDETNGKVIVLKNDSGKIVELESPTELEYRLERFFHPAEEQWYLWSPALDSQVVDTQRITRQHSVFLFGLPEVESEMFASEIVIPYGAKAALRTELAKTGISEKTLFADLLGFYERNTHAQPYERPLPDVGPGESLS